MRVEVYEPEKEPEKVLRLQMSRVPSGVQIIAVDDEGFQLQSIGTFDGNGMFCRNMINREFAEKFGIRVDAFDRIAVQ